MRLGLTLAAVLVAACASAQVVTNPTKIEYTPSADHAALSRYQVGYFLPTTATPFQVFDLPIVPPDATTGRITQPLQMLVSVPIGVICHAKIKAFAGLAESDWSEPSGEFNRGPAPVNAPTVRR